MNAPSNITNTVVEDIGIDGDVRRMRLCRTMQLLCETLAPREDGAHDDVVRAVLEELLEDV